MYLLHSNDWHFAIKNPASRVDDYNGELRASLDNITKLVERFPVRAVCVAGDIFHNRHKAPWDVVIWLQQWARCLRALDCLVLVIPGNHDERHNRYESLGQTPFGTLVSSGLFLDVSFQSLVVDAEPPGETRPVWVGPHVYGIPWPDGASPTCLDAIPQDADVVMVHGFATPEGLSCYGTFCHKYDELARGAPHVKVWHFGHDHADHGVYQLKNGAYVLNTGALSRGSLDHETLIRDVKVVLTEWDTRGEVTVKQILMPVPPVAEIFDLSLRQQRAQEQRDLEQIVQTLTASLAGGMVGVSYREVLDRTPLDAAVRAKVEHYISQAETV